MQETEDQGYEFDPVFLLHQIPRFCTRFSPGFLSQIENISVISAHIFFFHSADEGGANWFSGWFSWCPTSEKLLEIAESQILESECFLWDCKD